MKKALLALLVMCLIVVPLVGCGEDTSATTQQAKVVAKQDSIYDKGQPVPIFNWSLQRDLWIQFYRSQNDAAGTYSAIVSDYGKPLFITQSIGYPIPMDTQLTNPLKLSTLWSSTINDKSSHAIDGVLMQSEPNGLYTSPNTNATIIMTTDGEGMIAPVYSESKVLAFPFPVVWNDKTQMFERVAGKPSTINLKVTPQK
jgi:hypothetical protein